MKKENALFASFIRQHQSGLRSYIRGLGIYNHAVDDIAQEAFIVAYKKMESFDTDLDFGHWLRGIAKNIVRNELRKKSRQNRILNETLTQYLVDEIELSHRPFDYNGEELSALNECITNLPDKSRDLIRKRYSEECNATELGKHFEMTATAVRIALMRIRTQLKKCIDLRIGYEG